MELLKSKIKQLEDELNSYREQLQLLESQNNSQAQHTEQLTTKTHDGDSFLTNSSDESDEDEGFDIIHPIFEDIDLNSMPGTTLSFYPVFNSHDNTVKVVASAIDIPDDHEQESDSADEASLLRSSINSSTILTGPGGILKRNPSSGINRSLLRSSVSDGISPDSSQTESKSDTSSQPTVVAPAPETNTNINSGHSTTPSSTPGSKQHSCATPLQPISALHPSVISSSSAVSEKKKKKKHKKSAEAKSRYNKARRERKKIVVVAQSSASVLLPEGEEQLIAAKQEIKTKLLQKFKENITLIEKPHHINEFISTVIRDNPQLESFYLVDLGVVIRQKIRWDRALPRVKPYYAVKSNPDSRIVKTLLAMGAGFDCASKNEIIEVMNFGCAPSNIIFANPCKPRTHIQYAKEKGILRMTFDNIQEIDKIHEVYPEAHLVLRLLPDDSHSTSPLGSKFGASQEEWGPLLDHCNTKKMKVIGVSFHVGSGNWDTSAHTAAINLAKEAFILGEKKGFNFTLLDIGGGWPGTDDGVLSFDTIATSIGPQINELFPPNIEVISEPGRYFCTEAYTLAVSIISKREKYIRTPAKTDLESPSPDLGEHHDDTPKRQILYYMAEGLYGSFNNIIFDHFTPSPLLLNQQSISPSPSPQPTQQGESTQTDSSSHVVSESPATVQTHHSKLFGPTCDSIDVIIPDIELPDLEVGSWLYFVNMGAYTSASASSFNGFTLPNAFHFIAI